MSRQLLPCPSCARHVVADEAFCPFCHAMVRVSRRELATAIAAISMGVAAAACRPRPKYGMPPPPAPPPTAEGPA
jgi:hypothetical protein